MTLAPQIIFKLNYQLGINGLTSRDIAPILKVTESYISHIKHVASCSVKMNLRVIALIKALEMHNKKNKKTPLFFPLVNESEKEWMARKKEILAQFKKDYNLIF
jgi:hypothetical protein